MSKVQVFLLFALLNVVPSLQFGFQPEFGRSSRFMMRLYPNYYDQAYMYPEWDQQSGYDYEPNNGGYRSLYRRQDDEGQNGKGDEKGGDEGDSQATAKKKPCPTPGCRPTNMDIGEAGPGGGGKPPGGGNKPKPAGGGGGKPTPGGGNGKPTPAGGGNGKPTPGGGDKPTPDGGGGKPPGEGGQFLGGGGGDDEQWKMQFEKVIGELGGYVVDLVKESQHAAGQS